MAQTRVADGPPTPIAAVGDGLSQSKPTTAASVQDARSSSRVAPPSPPPSPSTPWLTRFERNLLGLSTVVKLLLWPCYHSTDFEVHRNWLAITHSLPLRQWYFDATSQWTLDYPPFFAYFSYILALPAPLVDPLIVALHEGLEYAAWPAKAYMRATVMATELVLAAALVAHSRIGAQRRVKAGHQQETGSGPTDTATILAASLFMHPGLIIIDHIHFQYNGFLFGVLLWSLWAAREDRPLLCAFLFSSLLNLKHIYIYIAPAFFVYLLRSYIYPPGSQTSDLAKSLERLIILGMVTVTPFILSLVPLMLDGARGEAGAFGTLSQMVSRLFPFSRGLIHAYWAPNAWALWAFADRVLVKLFQRRPALLDFLPHRLATKYHHSASGGFASASRGLVGQVSFAVLPDILPPTCFLLTLTCTLVYMLKLWQAPTYRSFLSSVSLCGFASFLFGWHVHEKAIMLVLVPYTFLAAEDYAHFRTFVLLSTAGTVSLFPLLYEAAETPIKLAYTLVWMLLVFGLLSKRLYRPVTSNLGILVHAVESAYLYGFILLQIYVSVVHPLVFPSPLAASVEVGHHASPVSAALPAVSLASSIRMAEVAPSTYANTASISTSSMSSSIPSSTPAEGPLEAALAPDALSAAATPEAAPLQPANPPPPTANAPDEEEDSSVTAPSTPPATILLDDGVPAPSSSAPAVEEPFPPPPQQLLNQTTSSDLLSSPPSTVVAAAAGVGGPNQTTRQEPTNDDTTSMEFLPLMMVSVYCSIGVVWSWLRASSLYLAAAGLD